jgi:hypothetical protein
MNNKLPRFRGTTPLNGTNFDDFEEIDMEIDNIDSYQKAEQLKNKLNYLMSASNSIYNSSDPYMIMKSGARENLNQFGIAKDIVNGYDDKLVNYVAAIVDPEYNYNTGVMVKQPSLVNPPSVSIPIKTLTTIPSEGFSSICISWNPTMFCTTNVLSKLCIAKNKNDDSKIYANKICSVLYSVGKMEAGKLVVSPSSWNAPVKAIPDNLPEVGVAKARLVSSKIKISFRGPVLNQGGTIMAAATFQGPPGIVACTPEDGSIKRNSDQEDATWADLFKVSLSGSFDDKEMSPFEEKIISNGIWAKNVNITNDANGITAVFIPTDPMDEIFCKPGTFYGEPIEIGEANGPYATSCLYTDLGARMNYLFNIQGIPGDNNSPIVVETYTTWEAIPTNQSASTLRNSAALTNSYYISVVKEAIAAYLSKATGISASGNKLAGAWSFVGDLVKNLPGILGTTAQVISAAKH